MGDENLQFKKKGVFIGRKTIFLAFAGALGTVAALVIGKNIQKIKPALVEVAKEGYSMKEWVSEKIERVKEDIEDILAEAKHAYHEEVLTTKRIIQTEKEILERIERVIAKREEKGGES